MSMAAGQPQRLGRTRRSRAHYGSALATNCRRVEAAAGVGLALLAILPGIGTAQAQDVVTTSQLPATDGRTIYGPDYFMRYSPSTAEDVLRVIPGVSAILDAPTTSQPQRGFGSGGTRVLANGRRFPGKANDLMANLRRIPATIVERIELISGSASGISVQSEGILVNVVMKEGASLAGSGSWETNLRFNDEGRTEVDGLLTYNGSVGALGYALGVERNVWSPPGSGQNRWSDRFREEVYYYPDGLVLEERPQEWSRDHDKWIYTAGLTYDFERGDRLQLNGFYQTLDIHERDRTAFTRFDRTGLSVLEATEAHERIIPKRTTLEFGGEYDANWGPGSVRVLGISRRDNSPSTDFRNQEAGQLIRELSRSESTVDTGEDILRGIYSMSLWPGHSLELGGEGARNTLDQDLRVFFDLNTDGRVEEVTIPTAQAHVEESRGEAFATYRYSGDQLSLESSLTYETATITNNYPFSPERQLDFVKPRMDARYRLSAASQVRLLVERTISQLDFNLFVPRFDFVDNEIDPGNPGIEPEKTWTYEAGYEHRLPNDGGLVEARVFYKDITDAIDKILLFDGLGRPFSADGNISEATLYGAEIKASLRLAPIVPDALLSLRYAIQDSETTDPFTGENRRLKSDAGENYDISFRQDLTNGISYGFTYSKVGQATIVSDRLVREYYRVGPALSAFFETQVSEAISFRLEAQNLTGGHEDKTRLLYARDAADGALRRYEQWDETRDMRFAAKLIGRF
jgi:outer membrane receptor for ferrienterochelin and colicins